MTLLKPYISVHLDAQIWKLVIDPIKSLLFAETRDTENRETHFTGIDLKSGQTNFKKITQPEKWLTGLDGAYNGTMFLHGYQSAQSPVHKGITAIDAFSGNVLWNNYIYAIHHISNNGPVGYNTQLQPPKLFLLDANTGAALRPYNASIDILLAQNITVPQIIAGLPDGSGFYFDGELTGNTHYMEYNSFRIVSLHTLNNGFLKQLLLISNNGQLVYEDLLVNDIQKLQPESFIMHQNHLIYIKNKIQLKVLNL